MFPLKSLIPLNRLPFATIFLILINTAIFIYISYYNTNPLIFLDFGLVPSKIGAPGYVVSFYEKIYPFFSYSFLHGAWWHLILNMYFLYIFGCNTEDKLGISRFFLVYILFGVAGGICQVVFTPTSSIPIVGASGAIAGVMGLYIVLFPFAKIKTLIIVIIFIMVRDIPAIIFIILWFAVQLVSGLFGVDKIVEGGVAWWTHIGGFGAGIACGLFYRISGFFKK